MAADEHDGAGEEDDRSKTDLAELKETNGQHLGLATQSALMAPSSASNSAVFPSSPFQSLTVLSTDAAHSSGKDNVADMNGADDGSSFVGKTIRERSKHRRKSSAAPNLSLDTRAMNGLRDRAPEAPRSPLSPVSPESPPQLPLPMPHLRSPSSSRTRDRGISLRRAILARNSHEEPESSGSTMELRPTAPSAMQQVPVGSGSGKKSKATNTILPVPGIGSDLETHPQPTKKAYESLALPHYETWIKSKSSRTGLLSRFRAAKERIRKEILRIQDIPPSTDGRHIDVDPNRRQSLIDERTGRKYINNTITSSRYTLYSFLPRQLFAQFSKLANFYFLCVSILQMIPGLSTTGTYTTIVPLAFFVIISMAKEGYDDFRRYRLDRAENRNTALVLRGHKARAASTENIDHSTVTSEEQDYWAEIKWEDIGVGDVVKLVRDGPAPADLVVLCTNGAEEMAYVETMALDGETNLKSKGTLPQLASSCRTMKDIVSCGAHIVVEDPNLDLYNFEGRVTIGDETLPLANNEIIYRGSVLRNTYEAIGIVVYSGEGTHISEFFFSFFVPLPKSQDIVREQNPAPTPETCFINPGSCLQ